MNQTEFLSQLKALFADFTFEVSDIQSISGVKRIPIVEFRDKATKDSIRILGSRRIFISGQMYPNTSRDFIYCTIHTSSLKRYYRCKNWNTHEHKKLYISARNYELLLEKLKEQIVEIND